MITIIYIYLTISAIILTLVAISIVKNYRELRNLGEPALVEILVNIILTITIWPVSIYRLIKSFSKK